MIMLHNSYLLFSVEPMIWIPNQLVGAPIGSNVTLECHTDSSPKAIAYWIFNNNMVLNSATHRAEDQFHSMYKLDSRLHIKNLQKKDFGSYKCVSKNSLGDTEGSIMLYGEYFIHVFAKVFGNEYSICSY